MDTETWQKINLKWTNLKPENDVNQEIGKPCARSSHGVSWLQANSRLVVYGGEAIARTPLEASEATWVYEAESNKWRSVKSSPPPLRIAHSQALHESSSAVYIFGGRAGISEFEQVMNDLWKLDCSGPPGTEVWSEVVPNDGGSIPEGRSFHQMVCIGDSLYIFGGCGPKSRLNDLHRFDLTTKTWHNLGTSQFLKGRGGATMLKLNEGKEIAIIAGFLGEETKDGHKFDVLNNKWCDTPMTDLLVPLRPRSVAVCGSFPKEGVSIIFGGEVDPSEKGHSGAGGFENDVILLDEKTGKILESFRLDGSPEARGWSAGGVGDGKLYVFGGLAGDDENPRRLGDLWVLQLEKN